MLIPSMYMHAVSEFNIDPLMRNVTESEGMVEISITTV